MLLEDFLTKGKDYKVLKNGGLIISAQGKEKVEHLIEKQQRKEKKCLKVIDEMKDYVLLPDGGKYPNTPLLLVVTKYQDFDYLQELCQHEDRIISLAAKKMYRMSQPYITQKRA